MWEEEKRSCHQGSGRPGQLQALRVSLDPLGPVAGGLVSRTSVWLSQVPWVLAITGLY